MKKIFFTVSDFSNDDGSTVRIYGILNALADNSDVDIILISNATKYEMFHPRIQHIYLGIFFTEIEKRIFQGLLSILPPKMVYKIYFVKIEQIYNKLRFLRNEDFKDLVFFTYLDNSLAYLLYKNTKIPFYINDIHGIATIEFKYKSVSSIKSKIINFIKFLIVSRLDSRVFSAASGFIFVSQSMKNYFLNKYKYIQSKKIMIVKDGLNKKLCSDLIDTILLHELKEKYNVNSQDKIIMFIGTFKNLGGLLDLIHAFKIVVSEHSNVRLFLIGDGEDKEEALKKLIDFNLEDKVNFLGRISYDKLVTYQALGDIFVCPDKDHPYSHIAPHIKYFDALISCKPVINGNFDVINEININEELSLSFIPSNIDSLSSKINYALENYEKLCEKYKNNRLIACENLTYDAYIKELL